MGLALRSWIAACKLMKILPLENTDSEIEAPLKRSAIGGYAEKAFYEAEQLAEAIREDQTELLPVRMAEEFRRSEAERQQAKLREAEKRKREAAAMDMPPPDRWSVVAGRHRSRTVQSGGRMDPGEGCSRWGESPRKKLAARATMGTTKKLFQKGEKEKSATDGSGQGYGSHFQKGEKEKSTAASSCQGYDPQNPGYTSQVASGRDTGGSYTPETERVSPPPPQPPRHTLDLTSLVEKALEGIGATNSRSCEEDLLFDDAVRTPAPPGTEDDVVMEEPGDGQLDDLEAARRFLDEDNAL